MNAFRFAFCFAALAITQEASAQYASCGWWEQLVRDIDRCVLPLVVVEKGEQDSLARTALAGAPRLAGLSAEAETKARWERIRQELPPMNYSWSDVEYRFCVAYESCRISQETYEQALQDGRELYKDRDVLDPIRSLLDARRKKLEGVRFQVTQGQSCTKGNSGGKKTQSMSTQCPSGTLRDGPARLHKERGGC